MFKRIAEKFNRFIAEKEAERRDAALMFANDFLWAVEKNEKQTVGIFFDQKGVDPNGRLAQLGMCVVAENGLGEMADLLLSKGVPADSLYSAFGTKTAIDIARKNGHDALADKLQKRARPQSPSIKLPSA
jgi:hypothetical protein